MNGRGGITEEVLPDGGNIINSDSRKQFVTDDGEKGFQLLCVIVIAFDGDIRFIEREPANGIITDGNGADKALAGGFLTDEGITGGIGFL